MADNVQIEDMATLIQDLRRRIETLETTTRLVQSSVQGGSIRILDDSGTVVAEFGRRASDGLVGLFVYGSAGQDAVMAGQIGGGDYGLQVKAASNRPMFKVDDNGGVAVPIYIASWVGNVGEADDANGRKTTTSGSYSTLWRINKLFAAGDQFGYNFNLSIPAGTTVDVRLRAIETGGLGTPAILASATGLTNTTSQFIGIATVGPSATISGTDGVLGRYFNFSLEMRRTAGAGTPAAGPVEQSRFYPV